MKNDVAERCDVVVVGGSAAGVTAAITVRRHYPSKKVLLIRKEEKVPIPCGIPYIFGTLGSPEKNLIPDALLETNKIDFRIATVTSIDRAAKTVSTTAGSVGYDRLILATGSSPIRPRIPGVDLEGVFPIEKDVACLHQLQDDLGHAKHIVIIGGGFIGIEFADEINKAGDKKITVVEMAPRCLSLAYDDEFCVDMEELLKSRGIEIRTSSLVEEIEGNGRVRCVRLRGGSKIDADLVILGIGSKANVELGRDAGLRVGDSGGLSVDRTMRTSDPSIFACGDCTEKISFFGGRPSYLKLASIAELEARIAGANLFGIRRESDGTLGVWCTAVGPLALGTAGLTEVAAKELGYQVVCASVEGPNRHPGTMPGAAPTKLKLVFEVHSNVLIGGQIRGGDSVGEMTNIVAACIQKRMTVEDIATFQMGTHPALTASPIAYHIVNAAEIASQSLICAEHART
ncbi:FAD-dependent oxidoreductase [Candidatus Sumerlaeota bacterium]|nr:FAD-dependent oxidoreductase [Candidatus Sumerlaeota bacterium]